MKSYYKTIIPGINSIKADFDYSVHFGNDDKQAIPIDKRIFEEDWLKTVASFGLVSIKSGFLFFSPAHFNSKNAHIDKLVGEDANEFSFNWMICGKGSEMIWYDIPEEIEPTLIPTRFDANKKIYTWKCNDLIEIDRTVIDDTNYMLVRTDIPHTIVTADEPRMLISIRFNITKEHIEKLIEDGVVLAK